MPETPGVVATRARVALFGTRFATRGQELAAVVWIIFDNLCEGNDQASLAVDLGPVVRGRGDESFPVSETVSFDDARISAGAPCFGSNQWSGGNFRRFGGFVRGHTHPRRVWLDFTAHSRFSSQFRCGSPWLAGSKSSRVGAVVPVAFPSGVHRLDLPALPCLSSQAPGKKLTITWKGGASRQRRPEALDQNEDCQSARARHNGISVCFSKSKVGENTPSRQQDFLLRCASHEGTCNHVGNQSGKPTGSIPAGFIQR